MNESNPNSPVQEIENKEYLRNVIGLASDYKNQRIYFSDIQKGNIQFVPYDAIGSERNFTEVVKG